jgi:hypothetical protein
MYQSGQPVPPGYVIEVVDKQGNQDISRSNQSKQSNAIYNHLVGSDIRLALLNPNNDTHSTTGVISKIIQFSLDSPSLPSFRALSYAWGSDVLSHSINVSGHTVDVTENLFNILQTLSSAAADQYGNPLADLLGKKGSRYLWIDAICIYSYRPRIKCCRNLRFEPRFCEEFMVRVLSFLEAELQGGQI